jgi:hypothetical protein
MLHRIIVSGIYRSGTSLVTELIHLWGAYAGREDDIFQDKYGYMEHFALQKFNDELLNNNSRVPTPTEQLVEKAQDPILKERALQILDAMDKEARENQAVAWVWKDPRLPLVLPFWSNIWGDVIYVVPVRHRLKPFYLPQVWTVWNPTRFRFRQDLPTGSSVCSMCLPLLKKAAASSLLRTIN